VVRFFNSVCVAETGPQNKTFGELTAREQNLMALSGRQCFMNIACLWSEVPVQKSNQLFLIQDDQHLGLFQESKVFRNSVDGLCVGVANDQVGAISALAA
jgi:hypothetical protein